jgi:hypothetical protein
MAGELANQSPCDPKTLTRAARDFVEKNPGFALTAGLAALRWLSAGYGYAFPCPAAVMQCQVQKGPERLRRFFPYLFP